MRKGSAQPFRIRHRNGAPEIVVLKPGDAVECVNLADRQLVLVEPDNAEMTK
ncbi:hypothetical protein D3C81_2144280 [compost metagenome]